MEPLKMEEYMDIDNDTTCNICYGEFLDIEDLKLHINQYHLNDTRKFRYCKFCSRIFADIETFVLHIRNEHLRTLKTCKYCTRAYNNRSSLCSHEKKHKSDVYYPKVSCSHCIKVFKSKRELETHEYENHSNSDDGVMLQYCFPELSSVINMNAKNFFKAFHENQYYRCIVCELSTPDINAYIDHLFRKRCRSLSCNICSNVYKLKSKLRTHCKAHLSSQNGLHNKCSQCNDIFPASKFKAHIKICNNMKCIPCNIGFDTVDKFATHITTHAQNNNFRCEICKYCRRPLVGLAALEKHIERTHKPYLHLYKYRCIYCDIVFKHPKLLFGHFFSRHRDINPYTCKICNKDFRIRKNFTLHIKLDHKSVGFVEFDSNYHVFFTDKKSEKPFQPRHLSCANSFNEQNPGTSETKSFECVTITSENTDALAIDDLDKKLVDKSSNDDTLNVDTLNDDTFNLDTLNASKEPQLKAKDTFENEKDLFSDQESFSKLCEESQDLVSTNKSNEKSFFKDIIVETIIDNTLKSKKEDKNGVNLVNVNSDYMTATETEADQNETESKQKMQRQNRTLKIQPSQTRKTPKTLISVEISSDEPSSDESDMPLSKIVHKISKGTDKRKMAQMKSKKVPVVKNNKKMKFKCVKCDRNCYTYQNYHRHMSLHMKNGHKICVKCFEKFKTKEELNEHMRTEHSGSKLTETLKKILDKRKANINLVPAESSSKRLFLNTIQKAQIEQSTSRASIVLQESDQSPVKQFIENFKPDGIDSGKKINISNSLSIKLVKDVRTTSMIKMTKFKPEPEITSRPHLRKPVKFKEEPTQVHKVTVKLVNSEHVAPKLNFGNKVKEVSVTDRNSCNTDQSNYEESFDTDNNNKDINPDVGNEVSLDNSQTKGKVIKQTIVLKDLLPYDVRIGHLAPKEPFYKIVKIDDVLQKAPEPPKADNITLPNGQKLVSVNPLAHLLSKTAITDLSQLKSSKHYKPKTQDYRKAIIKAMSALDTASSSKKPTKKN